MVRFILLILIFACSCNRKDSRNPPVIVSDTVGTSANNDSLRLSNTDAMDRNLREFKPKYTFSTFQTTVYAGELALPNFRNLPFATNKEYRDFMTEGCKQNGVNFGGHYTIIQRACGAMCEHIFVVDRVSGKIFTNIRPNDGRYGYLYKKESRLLIANSNVFQDDSLKYYSDFFGAPELYVWKDDNFRLLQ